MVSARFHTGDKMPRQKKAASPACRRFSGILCRLPDASSASQIRSWNRRALPEARSCAGQRSDTAFMPLIEPGYLIDIAPQRGWNGWHHVPHGLRPLNVDGLAVLSGTLIKRETTCSVKMWCLVNSSRFFWLAKRGQMAWSADCRVPCFLPPYPFVRITVAVEKHPTQVFAMAWLHKGVDRLHLAFRNVLQRFVESPKLRPPPY